MGIIIIISTGAQRNNDHAAKVLTFCATWQATIGQILHSPQIKLRILTSCFCLFLHDLTTETPGTQKLIPCLFNCVNNFHLEGILY